MTAEDQSRRALEAVQADMLQVVRKHVAAIGLRLTLHALIELTGSMATAITEADPKAQTDIDQKIADLGLFVAGAGQRLQ